MKTLLLLMIVFAIFLLMLPNTSQYTYDGPTLRNNPWAQSVRKYVNENEDINLLKGRWP